MEAVLCDEMMSNLPCSAMQTTGLKEDLTTVYNYNTVKSRHSGRKGFKLWDSWLKNPIRNYEYLKARNEKEAPHYEVASIQGNLPRSVRRTNHELLLR